MQLHNPCICSQDYLCGSSAVTEDISIPVCTSITLKQQSSPALSRCLLSTQESKPSQQQTKGDVQICSPSYYHSLQYGMLAVIGLIYLFRENVLYIACKHSMINTGLQSRLLVYQVSMALHQLKTSLQQRSMSQNQND